MKTLRTTMRLEQDILALTLKILIEIPESSLMIWEINTETMVREDAPNEIEKLESYLNSLKMISLRYSKKQKSESQKELEDKQAFDMNHPRSKNTIDKD